MHGVHFSNGLQAHSTVVQHKHTFMHVHDTTPHPILPSTCLPPPLQAHFATEHGDTFKMSAAQRRQALSIPLNLQYRSRDDEETEPGPSARFERAGEPASAGQQPPSITYRTLCAPSGIATVHPGSLVSGHVTRAFVKEWALQLVRASVDCVTAW